MRWTSPWDGGDRRALRAVVTAVCLYDAVYVVKALIAAEGTAQVAEAPGWLLLVAGSRPVVALLALIVVWFLLRFARGKRPIVTGLGGLVALGVLVEAYAATHGGPYRANFCGGAMLLGWIAGLGVARTAGLGREQAQRLAEAGAVALLSATYAGAALSKLTMAGAGWLDGTTIRAVVLAHAPVDGSGMVGFFAGVIVASPGLAVLLAIATIAIQAAGGAYPIGRRARIAVGTLLIAFHLGVALTTRIGYWQPVALLIVFSYPWPRLVAPLRRATTESVELDPVRVRRSYAGLGIGGLLVVCAGWLGPWRAYTGAHHRYGPDARVSHRAIESFGPIAVGDRFAQQWVVVAIDLEPTRARVTLEGDPGRFVLWVEPRTGVGRTSPFDTEAARVYYGETAVPIETLSEAARAVADRVGFATTSAHDVEAWLRPR